MAAGLAMTLTCAGQGSAGTIVPIPSKKPDSIRSTALALGLSPVSFHVNAEALLSAPVQPLMTGTDEPAQKHASAHVPRPSHKPAAPAPLQEHQIAAVATQLAGIEPASFTPDPHPGQDALGVPLPPRKPAPQMQDVGSLRDATRPTAGHFDPLSDTDADLYRQAFAAQANADWAAADSAMAKLTDLRLRGHLLFQRYMHPDYKATFSELQAWMELYSDHPGADRIYKLAALRRPVNGGKLKTPCNQIGVGSGTLNILSSSGDSYEPAQKLSRGQERQIVRLINTVRSDISHGSPSKGLKLLSEDPSAKLMDPVEYDQLRSQIASGFLLLGKPDDALILALESAKRSGAKAPLAGWTGGLASWRVKDYATAAHLFEQVAKSPYTSAWMNAAGAYWASRAHARAGDTAQITPWLKQAAQHPRTFYGMIATRALGWDFNFDWDKPDFTKDDYNRLVKIPAAWRAMALVQAGQPHLAESELLQLDTESDPALKTALLDYTQQVNLPYLAMRIANSITRPDGKLYDGALYPLLPWQPKDGYTVDRALILAIARQESKFNTWAESNSGAVGLMQLMPGTANYIDGSDRDFSGSSGRQSLEDPETNLALGQKYVEQLLGQDGVNRDLLSLAVAYNAGPGNLRKWKKTAADLDDPLFFIETIPMAETRNYVERVLANYWIYRMRLNQPMPSLDSVAEGKWAAYSPLEDHGGVRFGQNDTPVHDAPAKASAYQVADSRN